MSTDDLSARSAAELNELFAVEVARIWRVETPRDGGLRAYSVVRTGAWREIRKDAYAPEDLPDYSTDANTVLPWLEKFGPYVSAEICGTEWHITISDYDCNLRRGSDQTFARAACIALLREHREKTAT